MIARNEERFLADCLASVRGIVSEIIVVDTGSTDRTRAIAEEAGAEVLDFAWCDDFSAARNVGVERATGTHILILDADERIAPGTAQGILEAARLPNLLLGCVPLHNASSMEADPLDVVRGAGRLGEITFVPRLFRNLPEMRFKRRVHETVADGFNELFAKKIGLSVAVPTAIVHYGDVPSHRQELEKDQRNETLLRQCLVDDPADGEIAGYLVVYLLKHRRTREAVAIGDRHFAPFLARNDARPAGYLPYNMVRIGYGLGLGLIEERRPADARRVCRDSRRHCPDGHPNLDYVEGLACLDLGDLDEAERLFRETLAAKEKVFAQPVLGLIRGELSMLKLAGVQLLRQDYEAAARELPPRVAQWCFPVDMVLAEIDMAKGRPADAMEKLAAYVDRPSPPPDWHALVHRALTVLGKDADELLVQARKAAPSEWLERRRIC